MINIWSENGSLSISFLKYLIFRANSWLLTKNSSGYGDAVNKKINLQTKKKITETR